MRTLNLYNFMKVNLTVHKVCQDLIGTVIDTMECVNEIALVKAALNSTYKSVSTKAEREGFSAAA